MLQLRSTAKVLNQQSKWGRVLSPHKVFTNLLPRLLWIRRFQYLRCIFARVIVGAEYWLTCVYVCVLTWTGVHRAPLYTQAALPKSARIHRPPKQHFRPGPESSAACTEKTATVFWSYLLILTWPSLLVANEPINKGIDKGPELFFTLSSPQWYYACVAGDGPGGLPTAWPVLCTRSFSLLAPRLWPEQTGSTEGRDRRKKGLNIFLSLTTVSKTWWYKSKKGGN